MMKLPLCSLRGLLSLLLFAAAAYGQTTGAPSGVLHEASARDRAAIEAVVQEQDVAWAKGDAEAYTARALPEVLLTNVVGAYSVGKGPLLKQVSAIFSTIYKGSRLKTTIVRVTLASDDVALVDCMTELRDFVTPPRDAAVIDGAVHTRLQEVLVRSAGKWWLASLHNVIIDPAYMPNAKPPV